MGPRGCGVGAEGSGTSVEDLSGGKPEPDAVSGESGKPGPCDWDCPEVPTLCAHHQRISELGRPATISSGFPCFVEPCARRDAAK